MIKNIKKFLFFFFFCLYSGKPHYIIIGLPKSGTYSFHVLFQENNLKSIHWIELTETGEIKPAAFDILRAKNEGLPLLHYLDEYDAISEMDYFTDNFCFFPQIENLERLYIENKDSNFILSFRNTESHLNSMKNFYSLDKQILHACSHLFDDNPVISEDDKIKTLIENHNNNVRSFFRSKPEAKFYEFDLDNQNSTIFQLMGLTNNFPHVNISPKICYE